MKTKYLLFIPLLLAGLSSCRKEWLSARSDNSLVVPSTIADHQALLDNTAYENVAPILGEESSDNYYILYTTYQSLFSPVEQNAYVWKKDNLYGGAVSSDWFYPYQAIFYSNVALDGIAKITPQPGEQSSWNNVKGSGLFYRSWEFYHLLQLFAKPYNSSSANTDPGIPLKLSSDINASSVRATVQQSYDQIISDLDLAIPLLPATATVKTRPSQAAAYALLSKVYFSMGNYSKALDNANLCLGIYNTLMDYNTFSATAKFPFLRSNAEEIFDTYLINYEILIPSYSLVDSNLYKSYDGNDLRKTLFFKPSATVPGAYTYSGNYNGKSNASGNLFGGIATDEMYLIRAECYARTGDVNNALADLNTLLSKRYLQGSYVPASPGTAQAALDLILQERRKELIFRGIRFMDLRRLNVDPRYAVTLKRILNGTEYDLPPNDPRYVMPIPDDIIAQTGMQQNPR